MRKNWLYLLLIPLIIIGSVFLLQNRNKSQVYAEGGIEVTAPTPLFNASNLKPGDKLTGRVTLKNASSEEQRIGLRLTTGRRTDISFAGKLNLEVKNTPINKKLSTLFLTATESYLFNLLPNESREAELVLTFDPNSVDFYQGKSLTFDFSLGFIGKSQMIRIPTLRPRR